MKGDVVLKDERVISNIMEAVVGGISTTSSILSSTIFFPSSPSRVPRSPGQRTAGEEVRSGDKVKSPLMEALELESHRLLLVMPTLLARLSRKDVDYNGYTINKGTIILSNVWKLHHGEKIWGDPWKFRPERFLDENGLLLPSNHTYRTSWIPFGIGKRACPGEPFGRIRYFLNVATLLRNWRFFPSKDQPLRDYDPRHLENFDLEQTLRPKPYLCRIEKREWN